MGRTRYVPLIAVGDIVLSGAAFSLAFLLRFGGFPTPNWEAFLQVLPFSLGATVFFLALYNAYRDLHRPFLEVAAACVLSTVLAALFIGVVVYLNVGARAFPRSIWILGTAIQACLLSFWRLWFVRRARHEHFQRPAVLVSHRFREWSPRLPEYIHVVKRVTPTELARLRKCMSGR